MKFEYFSITIAENDANPFFSIIMPVYNKAPYIRDTISSILNQTDSSYEVIMIGGASTDDTDIICQEYANTNPDKFRYITQSGKGVSTARNDGILAAKGKYIAFLDADDIWIPEYLETMKKLIDDYPDAVFYAGGHIWRYPDGKERNGILPVTRGYINYFRVSIDYKGIGTLTSWIIYERETLLKVGLFNTTFIINEDCDLATRMALAGCVAYEPKNLGIYQASLPGTLSERRDFWIPIPASSELTFTEQTPEIIEYHEYWIQRVALENILRGYPNIARKQLKEVVESYQIRKLILITISYLPKSISRFLHTTYLRLRD